MANSVKQIGRLALRVEGENWNAYYALTETMEEAIFLGSIRMGAVRNNLDRKQSFMNLMRAVVSDILEERIGSAPHWSTPRVAPESERSGNA